MRLAMTPPIIRISPLDPGPQSGDSYGIANRCQAVCVRQGEGRRCRSSCTSSARPAGRPASASTTGTPRPPIRRRTWPGVPMTAEANDWFVYTFPTAEAASIVFNDGAGRQTGNLRRDSDGWFYTNNTWYALNPERPAIPVIRATPRGAALRPAAVGDAREQQRRRRDLVHDRRQRAVGPRRRHRRRRRRALPAADRRRGDDDDRRRRHQLGRRGRPDPHLRLHHRSECRPAAPGGDGEPPQRHLPERLRRGLHHHRQPAGAGRRLLHHRRLGPDHRLAGLPDPGRRPPPGWSACR